MQTWQYKIELVSNGSPRDDNRNFNNLGKDGWELVAVNDGKAYFKKKIDPGIQPA